MADLSHNFGGDLQVDSTGDLLTVDGPALTTQRLLRRYLTQPGAYIWHLQYGAGLGAMVGQPANPLAIRAVINSQTLKEATVASSPVPAVTVTAGIDGTVTASVAYADASGGETQTLTLPG